MVSGFVLIRQMFIHSEGIIHHGDRNAFGLSTSLDWKFEDCSDSRISCDEHSVPRSRRRRRVDNIARSAPWSKQLLTLSGVVALLTEVSFPLNATVVGGSAKHADLKNMALPFELDQSPLSRLAAATSIRMSIIPSNQIQKQDVSKAGNQGCATVFFL